MGSTTGHTVVALRMDGKLYITESTTNGAYWPTNGYVWAYLTDQSPSNLRTLTNNVIL
jgi:hypothetical protein